MKNVLTMIAILVMGGTSTTALAAVMTDGTLESVTKCKPIDTLGRTRLPHPLGCEAVPVFTCEVNYYNLIGKFPSPSKAILATSIESATRMAEEGTSNFIQAQISGCRTLNNLQVEIERPLSDLGHVQIQP